MDGNAERHAPESQFAPPQFHSGDHFPPPSSVVLHDHDAPRRTGLFVVVGLLLTAVVAAGVFLLTRSDEAAATYSLEAAVEGLDATAAVAYTVEVDAMGEEVSIDAEFDGVTGNTRLTMRMNGLFDDGIEMIVSTDPQVIYVSSDLFGFVGLDIETEWIKMDAAFLAEQGENSFESAVSNDVLNAGELLASATSVEEIGIEVINGEELQHYRVTVDKETALANSPQMKDQIADAGGEMPNEVVYDMWVTEDNQLRRMAIDLDIGPNIIRTVFTVKVSEEPISVTVPDDADVTDADELL